MGCAICDAWHIRTGADATTDNNLGSLRACSWSMVVMTVEHFMDDGISFDRRGVFEEPVRATLYRPGIRLLATERPFLASQAF